MTAATARPGLIDGTQSGYAVLHEFPAPEKELAWRDCLDRVECPAHYNAPEYFRETSLACERRFAVLAVQQGRVAGVLTGGYEGTHATCGYTSRPQVCVDETLDQAERDEAVASLARGLLSEARGAELVSMYSWQPLAVLETQGFRCRTVEGTVILDLTQGPGELFRELNKKRRNCIRAAQRNTDMEIVEPTGQKDIDAFYSVYSAWHSGSRKKIDGDKLPAELFHQRFQLTDNFRIFLARLSGQVIAGITLRFFPGGLVEYANNSSLEQHLWLRPNDLLLWRAIEWACAAGFERFSLGGAHRFLREFGGSLTPIYRYRLDRTLGRRHDLREQIVDRGRGALRTMPKPVEKAVRRILGKA
ncbi:MAG TPA: GNAT family N-acetyltransferase [Terriglobales bacterium]